MTRLSDRALAGLWPVVRVPLGTVAAVASLVVTAHLLGMSTPGFVLALGGLIGISYGLLGVCLTLIFRVSGVINLALPAIGLFAMAFMPLFVQVLNVPWWVAFVGVTPIGLAVGAATEAIVIRRLASAPRAVGVVASLGVAGVLASGAAFVVGLGLQNRPPLSTPPGLPEFTIGPLVVTPGYTGLIISAPVLTILLSVIMTRTRFGLAVRASAASPDNARLAGISPGLVSGVTWGMAGVISTVSTIFFLGNVPADPTTTVLSTNTLLPALGAAAIAGFRSLPRALAGGIVIGIVEQLMLWSPAMSDYVDLAILTVLFVTLMISRRVRGRGDAVGSWTAVTSWRPLPASLAGLWLVRNYSRLLLLIALAWIVYVATRDDVSAQLWTTTLCIAVVSLTVTLITGLGGELSLGQFAFALLGAGTSYAIVRDTGNFALGLLAAAAVGGVASVLLAYPSLRVRGLSLTILSLSLGVAVPTAFLANPHIMGHAAITPLQPVLGNTAIRAGAPYFLLAAVIAGVSGLLAWNVWRGGFGRLIRAARDNELAAQAFGIAVMGARMKLMLFTGAIAGLAGAVLIHSYTSVTANAFPVDINLRVVLAALMGGLGVFIGGPAGVLWLFTSAVAQSLSSNTGSSSGPGQAASLAIYGSALVLLLIAPGGVAQFLQPIRDTVALGIGRMFGVRYTMAQLRGEKRLEAEADAADPEIAGSEETTAGGGGAAPQLPILRATTHQPVEPGRPLLHCQGVGLRYGAVSAVNDLDVTVGPGEILGLIGPNGAGKTSTFELISGFARATTGRVEFAGHDITRARPDQRARLGLVRSFQDARLFPTMSTLEVVTLALERQQRTNVATSILGVDLTTRRRRRVAEEVIAFFGLTPYRESRIQELSTGSRRFVELAALISMRPQLLLLDEPSSGIAQRESEALGPLLLRLRREFELSMIVIEHDVPLVMSVADRVLVMDQGRELTTGTPTEVRADERVIDAYLGGAIEAVERSNQPTAAPSEQPC